MTLWVTVLLLVAYLAGILGLKTGAPAEMLLHNMVLFLIPLGMLVRIRFKSKQGEKERLQQKVEELTAELKRLQSQDREKE